VAQDLNAQLQVAWKRGGVTGRRGDGPAAVDSESQSFVYVFPEQARRDICSIESIAGTHGIGCVFRLNLQFRPAAGVRERSYAVVTANHNLTRTVLHAAAREFLWVAFPKNLSEFLISGKDKVAGLDKRQYQFNATV
jgi:hypothetical protein